MNKAVVNRKGKRIKADLQESTDVFAVSSRKEDWQTPEKAKVSLESKNWEQLAFKDSAVLFY